MKHEFMGYVRPDGQVGCRNHVAVIPSVTCAGDVASAVVRQVAGCVGYFHHQGCCQLPPDLDRVTETLISLGCSPNVGAALVISLGCEGTDTERLIAELRATGNNKNAAKYCGMAEKRNIIMTLAISGMLAGLGAAMLYLTGYEQWQCSTSSVPGMGFNGIAAAFLGGLNPIGAILASFFIQHITAGGAYVDKSMYCAQISDLISSIIIYLCGFVLFMKYAMNTAIAKREEKAALKEKERAQTPEVSDNGKGGDQ